MKKTTLLLLLALTIVIYQLEEVSSQDGAVGIGLQINAPPTFHLSEPFNNSGIIDDNPNFFHNITFDRNLSNCTLILNGKTNLTDLANATGERLNFSLKDLPVGKYNWSINCTDNLNVSFLSQVQFFTIVNMTLFNGTTTNLSLIDIRNVTNFVTEKPDFGKINFSEGIDLSQGFDLNKFINITSNKISLDSTALTGLNKSATLQLFGLTFSNPRIVKDGVVCPESICKKVSYSGGVLTFNVTHFTEYSGEETPEESGSSGGGTSGGGGGGGAGGGGGGGIPTPINIDFTVSKTALKVLLRQGETKTETFSIKNTGDSIFDVNSIFKDIGQFKVSPEEDEIKTTLTPNEEVTFELVFRALENEKPDIYPKKILIKAPSKEHELPAVIEVDSAQPLFDVDVEVLPDSKKIFPGEEALIEVNLFNVRGFGRVDVNVEYAIKDLEGTLLATEHETVAVETQAKFTRSLLVPSDLKPGTYVAFVKVVYGDSIGVSSDLFEVEAKELRLYAIKIKDYKFILAFGAIAVIAGIFIFSAYKLNYFRKKTPKEKVEAVKEFKGQEKAQKLQKELQALESAYKSGFISEESYQRDKKRIEEKLNSLK